jgi:hypothetical protein
MIRFKQFINESPDLDLKLKKLGLKRGGMGFKIGKVIGGEVYVHRNYENQFPQDLLNTAKSYIPKGYDYQVVKYNPKLGTFSFIKSSDFDTNPEPSVNGGITVKPDGTAKEFKDAGWIYHHKWEWVDDDYKGFDVEKEKQRSLKWSSLDGVDKTRIGQRKHWDTNVIPRLSENKVYDYVLQITDAGPFDGGCVFYAFALHKKIGGEVVVLVDDKDVAQHAAVLKDNKLYDYDGNNVPDKFIKSFNKKEHSNCVSYRKYKSTDLDDAVRGTTDEILNLSTMIGGK